MFRLLEGFLYILNSLCIFIGPIKKTYLKSLNYEDFFSELFQRFNKKHINDTHLCHFLLKYENVIMLYHFVMFIRIILFICFSDWNEN